VQRSAHPVPGTVGALAGAAVHGPLLPRGVRERLEPYRAERARTVGWATGACLAARTATLRRLGPFDPAIHLFGEDLDLCLRARAAGIRTVLHPDLRIRHAGGHATMRRGEPYDLLARTRRAAVRSSLGPRALALDDAAQALTFGARALAGRRRRRNLAELRSLVRVRRG
jgi:GT2 family glycosyltransferase